MSRVSPRTAADARPTMDDVIARRRENTMTCCLRPLLTSMRLFGLYFERQSEGSSNKKSCKCNPWMIYGILVVSVLWLNVARMFSVFTKDDKFSMVLLGKLVTIIWMIQCAVSQTSFYATCHFGKLQKVFMMMNLGDRCACYLRRMAIVYTISVWSVIAIAMAFFTYGLFISGGFMDYMLAPVASHATVPYNLLIIPRIVVYIISFYLSAAHAFPIAMTHLLATLFSFQFTHVSKELDRCLDSQDGQVGDAEIEMIRKQHQEISMSVSRIDDCLMFSNASAFTCQLCGFIIILYSVIFYNSIMDDPVIIAIHVFWIVLMTAGLVFTISGGIRINQYAHDISERVHDIDLMNLSAETIGKVNVFLSRLTGDPIGFSVVGIFVIDRSTILTLIGTLITYFLLIIQLSKDYSVHASPTTSNNTTAT